MIPPPNHHIDVSAYCDDSQRYGDFSGEVAGWTNAHYAWAYRYAPDSTTPALGPHGWIQGLVESCQRAYSARRGIHVNLNLQQGGAAATPLGELLKALSPFWPRVTVLEMADEPRWTKVAGVAGVYELLAGSGGPTIRTKTLPTAAARRTSTAATAAKVRALVKSLGLPQRPLSVVYTTAQFPGAPVDSLDIVGIEAYVDLPGDPVSARNVKWLTEYLAGAIAKVPATKAVHLVPMAYSRNYAFLGIGMMRFASPAYRNAVQCLVDIMAVPYAAARENKRVTGLNFFSWARASGSREYKRLTTQLAAIGKAACSGR
jgi:hypothetical protein